MTLYAWKITAPGRPDHEEVSDLERLQAVLDASGLPGSSPSAPIVERTRSMQHEGQGYYKANLPLDQRWTLMWIELGRGNRFR